MPARKAGPGDAAPIARIYNQGIEDRVATFETRLRSPEDVQGWFDGVHPIVVVEMGAGSSHSPPPPRIGRANVTRASPSFRSTSTVRLGAAGPVGRQCRP